MNTQTMVPVEYVGAKQSETDHLYGTGLVWSGRGDVQLVPADKWSQMKRHVDVWRALEGAPSSLAGAKSTGPKTEPVQASVPTDVLYGTNHPAEIDIGGKLVPLGDVVREAHAMSKMSVRAWNELDDQGRHDLVEHYLGEALKAAGVTGAGDGVVDLEAMDKAALRQLAEERGVKVHPNAGEAKLREALKAAGV
jgi:hypothetical protein